LVFKGEKEGHRSSKRKSLPSEKGKIAFLCEDRGGKRKNAYYQLKVRGERVVISPSGKEFDIELAARGKKKEKEFPLLGLPVKEKKALFLSSSSGGKDPAYKEENRSASTSFRSSEEGEKKRPAEP